MSKKYTQHDRKDYDNAEDAPTIQHFLWPRNKFYVYKLLYNFKL